MKCPVCDNDFISLSIHLSKMQDSSHRELISKIEKEVDDLLLNTNLLLKEISDVVLSRGVFCFPSFVYSREKQICPGRGYEIMGLRRSGELNPVKRKEVSEKISKSVSELWNLGVYENRQNGMYEKLGKDNPKFNVYTFLKWKYADIYKFYHENVSCLTPGCKKDGNNSVMNVHHIDEDKSNFLLTNLSGYCVYHHSDKHYGSRKTPYITVNKIFEFEAAHNLLDYDGKCSSIHGHSYKLEVSVRNRIDLLSNMVIDFGDLKKIVNDFVISKLDHTYINEVISINPTAESMLIWIWKVLEKDALLKGLYKIKLWETSTSCASVDAEGIFLSPEYVMTYYEDMKDFYKWENTGETNE